jgi:hypothetical protein
VHALYIHTHVSVWAGIKQHDAWQITDEQPGVADLSVGQYICAALNGSHGTRIALALSLLRAASGMTAASKIRVLISGANAARVFRR